MDIRNLILHICNNKFCCSERIFLNSSNGHTEVFLIDEFLPYLIWLSVTFICTPSNKMPPEEESEISSTLLYCSDM